MEEASSHVRHPNKRLKTTSPSPSPSPGGKGKAKVEEIAPEGEEAGEGPAVDADERTCGICLTEEGRSIRGSIDTCDHYFCFVCIMEWAKIESRCPLCKQRFGSIRRPPVRGVFFDERVVHVPVRDQVHQVFGNATGVDDPYADTTCSTCHSSIDENLLLLCDLCDSATHTYCVGLGFTVPEGDWYCHDCTILRKEHTKVQDDDYCSGENFNRVSRTMIEDDTPVSIFEVIHDETSSNLFSGSQVKVVEKGTDDKRTIPDRGVAERKTKDRAAIEWNSQGNILHSDGRLSHLSPAGKSASSFPEAKATELGARTLNQCRNVHLRIRILRENWCALRSGSLDFRSSSVSSCGTANSRKCSMRGVSSTMPTQQDCQSSGDNEEVTAGSRISSEMNNCTNSYDVDKAWKMLEIAKSMQKTPTGAKSSHQSPKLYSTKSICENKVLEQSVLQRTSDQYSPSCPVSKKLPMDRTHENRLFGSRGLEERYSCRSLEIVQESCKLQNGGKRTGMEETGLSFVRQNLKSNQEPFHGREGQNSQHGIHCASGSVRLKDILACSGPSNCMQLGTVGPSDGKKEAVESVGCSTLPSNLNSVLGKNADENSTRISDSAKSEIQSLVKLNLKLQCRGCHLGTEKFKEVARVATHTILAACGLDHSKPKARPFPRSICGHGDQANLRRSNLMPDSCRDCFYSFVKDVVDSVVSEKISASNSS